MMLTTKFSITVRLLTEMLGTVPKDKKIYKTYIESKKPVENKEDESATVQETEEKAWTGFHSDEKGLFVYDYFIKGFFKHSGNVQKDPLKIKALRSKLDDFLFVAPRRVYLNRMEPDGVLERPLRAMTPKGMRVTLARSDCVDAGVEFSFMLTALEHKDINWTEIIPNLLEYGLMMGFGQWRNGGYGRFEVVKCEEQQG